MPDDDLQDQHDELNKRYERVQRLAENLCTTEMADSVVILVTYHRGGCTQWNSGAAGNTFACAASAEKFALDKKAEWGR